MGGDGVTTVVVVGLGYVGLPLVARACETGMSVTGFDISVATVDGLNAGRSHVDDLSDTDVREMLQAGFRATTDIEQLRGADVYVICVPTPLSPSGGPDLAAVVAASKTVGTVLVPGSLVVLESTTYPGTTEELVRPILEAAAGLKAGVEFALGFSPERIDPGNERFGFRNTPKVVGGVTAECLERMRDFYGQLVDDVVAARGTREAEAAKLLENTYRHVNIALVNEMAKAFHELGIDIWDVIRLASTKPFGFQPFYPGPGVGGHCIPIDPKYLSYRVESELGVPFRFVELAQEINNSMPTYVAQRAQAMLNDARKPVRGSTVLLLGVTYKADIADQRESPAVGVASQLVRLGARVLFHDPLVQDWQIPEVEEVSDLEEALNEADLTILLQKHSSYDVEKLATSSTAFLDTRGAVDPSVGQRL